MNGVVDTEIRQEETRNQPPVPSENQPSTHEDLTKHPQDEKKKSQYYCIICPLAVLVFGCCQRAAHDDCLRRGGLSLTNCNYCQRKKTVNANDYPDTPTSESKQPITNDDFSETWENHPLQTFPRHSKIVSLVCYICENEEVLFFFDNDMAAGALYTYPDNFRAYKILIAAEYSGAKVTLPSFKFGETNQSAEFLKKFPLGKVPAFETPDGKCIYESNAIAYYVSNDQLRGKTPLEGALIQQYVNFADQEILPAVVTWVFPTLGLMQFNKQATDKAMEDVKKALTVLNTALLTRTFLVGERVTLADIAVGCNLLMLYKQVMEPSFRAQFGNVNRWFLTIVNQPQFKKILGEVKLCETMAKFDGKKFAELHPKKDEKKDKKAKSPKEEKPKQEQPKKEKKEKPKKEEDDEVDDVPKEPKSKDPYAGLPKSSFDMDAFKRVYSNKDTVTEAIPYFWEHFNKEDYSIWLAEYMYDDELKRIFMSCNLVSGMFQRIEKLRKTAFASVIIFGEDGNISISGVWICRTQKLAFDLNEDWAVDSPSYKFTKLDAENPEHKKLVNEYMAWEGDFGGKKVNQGKIFK